MTRGGLQALETEVRALRDDREEKKFYERECEERTIAYERKVLECEQLQQQVYLLSNGIEASKLKNNNTHIKTNPALQTNNVTSTDDIVKPQETITEIKTQETLTEMDLNVKNRINQIQATLSKLNETRNSRSMVLDMVESSEEESQCPTWADDIMSDLALIAEGHIPPSLHHPKISPSSSRSNLSPGSRSGSGSDSGLDSKTATSKETGTTNTSIAMDSVFDRLADPHNYTGVQKQRQYSGGGSIASREQKPSRAKKTPKKSPQPDRRNKNKKKKYKRKSSKASRDSQSSSEASGSPPPFSSPLSSPATSSVKKYVANSVYERLQDPSNFTGVHKAKFDQNPRRVRQPKI